MSEMNGNGNGNEPTIRFKVKDILQEIKASVARIEQSMTTKAESAQVASLEARVQSVELQMRDNRVAKNAVDRHKRMVYGTTALALLGLAVQIYNSVK